mgnify:CR=1 FL=1
MRAPETCTTMAELRAAIDALDEELVALLAARAAYIDRAVALKQGAGLPARIGPRVDAVIAHAQDAAQARGLDPDLAGRLWHELVEWSIAREARALGE